MIIKTEKSTVIIEELIDNKSLVLYNDDFNTFEFVIETLVDICGHSPIQAEQCACLVHYKGKCEIKQGTYEKLEPLCSELLRRGLTAEISN